MSRHNFSMSRQSSIGPVLGIHNFNLEIRLLHILYIYLVLIKEKRVVFWFCFKGRSRGGQMRREQLGTEGYQDMGRKGGLSTDDQTIGKINCI